MNIPNNLYEQAIKQYLGNHILKNLETSKEKSLELGYTVQELSYFAIDIHSMTYTDTNFSIDDIVKHYNEYLKIITSTILSNNGFINTIAGDSITALFGMTDKDHELDACKTSLECIEKLTNFESCIAKCLQIGIGVTTGQGAFGNFGSEHRIIYSCISDNLNFASRLQAITKAYNVKIIISEKTRSMIDSSFNINELEAIIVKGKEKPIKIYELY